MPWWGLVLRLTGVGWYMAFCVIGGVVGGLMFDQQMGTNILGVLFGVVLGTGLAFYGVYRMVQPLFGGYLSGTGSGSNTDKKDRA